MKQSVADLVTKTGSKNGYHVEHILSHNSENLYLFGNDEERFDIERNRLGAILLLKGKDNISSNNEPYIDKLKSYSNTLYWNETLREDTYTKKLDLRDLMQNNNIKLQPYPDKFGPEEVEARQQALFNIALKIWE